MKDKKAPKKDYTEFIIDHTPYRTTLNKTFTEREKWEKDNPKKIHSFIPGTIREIMVKPGDKVKENETLLILEAMKMRNRLVAPTDGKIKEIFVKSDETVPGKYLLVELE
jgi:biotin carboxyl carrier protein